MTSFLRFAFVLVFLLGSGLGIAGLASADPPSAAGPFPLSAVPQCLPTAPETRGAHICQLHQTFPNTQWEAATGEWIVMRSPAGSASQETCSATQASVVPTFTVDGDPIAVVTIPCEQIAGLWWVEWRALSTPLPPGSHTIAMSRLYTTAVGPFPAGTTLTFRGTLTVIPRGAWNG